MQRYITENRFILGNSGQLERGAFEDDIRAVGLDAAEAELAALLCVERLDAVCDGIGICRHCRAAKTNERAVLATRMRAAGLMLTNNCM